jgi:hypothetical protein
VLAFEEYKSNLSLLACLFIDDFEKDSQFAVKTAHNRASTVLRVDEAQHDEQDAERTSRAERLIQGCCKGLIDVRKVSQEIGRRHAEIPCVLFVHRSAIQFLRQPLVSQAMADHLSNFGAVEAASQLHLAELRRLHGCSTSPTFWRNMWTDIIHMRARHRIDERPYVYLESLEVTPISQQYGNIVGWRIPVDTCPGYVYAVDATCQFYVHEFHDVEREINVPVTRPVHVAALFGEPGYAVWKLSNEPTIIRNNWISTALLHCLLSGSSNRALRPSDYKTFQTCLAQLMNHDALASRYAVSLLAAVQWAIRMLALNDEPLFVELYQLYVSHFLKTMTTLNKTMLQTAINGRRSKSGTNHEHTNGSKEGDSMGDLANSWFNTPIEGLIDETGQMTSLRQHPSFASSSVLIKRNHFARVGKQHVVDMIEAAEVSIYNEMKETSDSQGQVTSNGQGTELQEAILKETTKHIGTLLETLWTKLFTQPLHRVTSASSNNGISESDPPFDGSVEIPHQVFGHINLHDGFGRSMIAVVVCILGKFCEVTATR